VLIDIASARLWMYEGDRVVDSMRIVVGKPDTPTPMMAGYLRQAVLNPYWNVPEHLVRKTIAAGVLSQGTGYLRARGYEVLSDWSDDPRRLDPAGIDWRAVAGGRLEVRVRQNPGAANAMGTVKFEFPNREGIYLHDTPDKDLLLADARQFSNGCVRLEDAERLGRWLLGGAMPSAGNPETRVDLRQPVPIYITYLTVQPDGDRLALGSDPYGRDGAARAPLARAH
jgi:murein L,D-transpeptidase YcbB/YkuD